MFTKGAGIGYDYGNMDRAQATWYSGRGTPTTVVMSDGIIHNGEKAFFMPNFSSICPRHSVNV